MLSVHRTPKQLKRVRKKSRTDPSGCPDSSVRVLKPQHKSPMYPFLRANPFPEVTDLFCRLPLSTLFYQLEAVHLGDLLRLWVRPGVKIIHSLGFSRTVESAPDRTEVSCSTKHWTVSPGNLISRWQSVKKKRKLFLGLPLASPSSFALPLKIHILVQEY